MSEVSVVVPVFNSTDSLRELVDRCMTAFRNTGIEDYEIVFVDDGSPDPLVWKVLSGLASDHERVLAFRLTRNFGKAGAVLCGMQKSTGKYVFTIDDDLQHRPEDFDKLLAQRDHDVVIGTFESKSHPVHVRIASRVKGWFDHILIGKPKGLRLSPFKLFQRHVVDSMLQITTPYPFIPALMFYVTKDIVTVPVSHDERKFGGTQFTFVKRLRQFSRLLINNSSLLLRMIAVTGIVIAILAVVYGSYLVFHALTIGVTIPGWTSLMVGMLLVGGLILFTLGVIGEYLIRIIYATEGKPAFIVRETNE